MNLRSLDPKALYLAVLETFKPVEKPGVSPVVIVNFVLDEKRVAGERLALEQRLAKHHFPCDAALVPDHPSAELLKQLAAFRPGMNRLPWSRLAGQQLLLRFGLPRSPGLHNPVEEILLPDGSVAEFPATREEGQDSGLVIDQTKFIVTWHGRSARFSDCNEFKLLVMLAQARGAWVTYEQIEEYIIQDTEIVTNRCGALKYRLVKKLRAQGISDLAEAIVSGTRKYRLNL
jgi:hypothetical protein